MVDFRPPCHYPRCCCSRRSPNSTVSSVGSARVAPRSPIVAEYWSSSLKGTYAAFDPGTSSLFLGKKSWNCRPLSLSFSTALGGKDALVWWIGRLGCCSWLCRRWATGGINLALGQSASVWSCSLRCRILPPCGWFPGTASRANWFLALIRSLIGNLLLR